MTLRKNFALRLKEEREAKSLTQPQFAVLGGVKIGAQGLYETGKSVPTLDYLFMLADHGVDVGYLVTGIRASVPLAAENGRFLARFLQLSDRERRAVARLVDDLAGMSPEWGSVASLLDPDLYAEAHGAVPPTLHEGQRSFRGKDE